MKATKKIVGAACALIAAVALSAGSTFAWFSANDSVTIDTIQATVVTKGGDLQIAPVTITGSGSSKKGSVGNYSYKLTPPAFQYQEEEGGSTVTKANVLDAVTTDDGVTFSDMGSYDYTNHTIDAGTLIDLKEANEKGAIVYTFHFSLRSTTKMKIYFNAPTPAANPSDPPTFAGTSLTSAKPNSMPKAAEVKAWNDIPANVYQAAAISAGDILATDAANAARVSFIQWTPGMKDKPNSASSVESVKFWAPHDSSDGSSGDGFYKGNLAMDYLINNYEGPDVLASHPASNYYLPGTADKIEILGTTDTVTASDHEYITIEPGVDNIITVNLWLEGKDGDCLNYMFGQTIKLDLAFFGVEDNGSGSGGGTGGSGT